MSLRRGAWAALAAAFLGALILRGQLTTRRYFDTDELEHTHAALLVAHGNLPFRDFFEHHGPLFWVALAPVVDAPRAAASKVVAGRVFMSLFWLCLLMLVARPRPGRDPLEGALAAVWLAWFGAFAQKSLEIRPDVPAAMLVVGAAWAIARPRRGAAAGAGALLGLALWFSPKALFPAAGLILAAYPRRRTGETLAGLAAVGAAGVAYFAARGGLAKLWTYYALYNAGFPGARVGWSATLLPSLLCDPLMWAAGLYGLRRWRERPEDAGALAAGLAGLAITPSAYPQHLLFVAPFLAGFACRELLSYRGREKLVAAAVAVSLLVPGANAVLLVNSGNLLQRERWRCASDLVADGAPVWDVWTGDAFHRPHAAFLWFVPDDSQSYYEPAALESQFVAALQSPRTRGAIRCESCLKRLSPPVTAAFDRYFEPSGCGRLWLRKKGV